MKFVGLLLLALGFAFAWYFLLFIDTSVEIPATFAIPAGRAESESLTVLQRNGLILSLATAMLGGLALALARYLPKSFKKSST